MIGNSRRNVQGRSHRRKSFIEILFHINHSTSLFVSHFLHPRVTRNFCKVITFFVKVFSCYCVAQQPDSTKAGLPPNACGCFHRPTAIREPSKWKEMIWTVLGNFSPVCIDFSTFSLPLPLGDLSKRDKGKIISLLSSMHEELVWMVPSNYRGLGKISLQICVEPGGS